MSLVRKVNVCGVPMVRSLKGSPPEIRGRMLTAVFAVTVLSVAGCSQGLPSAQQDAGESLRPLDAAQSLAQGDADEVDETFEVFFTNAQREAPSASLKEYYEGLTNYWSEILVCMEEKGWQGHAIEDPNTPAVAVTTPDYAGQETSYVKDGRECAQKAGPMPTMPALTRESAAKDYEAQVEFAQCAESQGFDLSDPPSLQQYTEEYLSGPVKWNPQVELVDTAQMNPREVLEFRAICPYW